MNLVTLTALQTFPDQLQSLYEAFPQEATAWAPASWDGVPSEALTAIEQICHVRDIEIDGYQVRLRRTRDEWNPFLSSIDTDALARERGYRQQVATAVLSSFRTARAETVQTIRALSPAEMERPARFEGYGPVTLRSLVHYLASHDQQHLSGLQWLLGKFSGRSAANAAPRSS
ncbi:MAG: DinB family protein [Burkholderiales bacterium]|jgi:hypothetical protein|nr:DinB family protein [Burkholderiales bacterium]